MASSRTQTTQVMSRSDVARAVTRIAHEIVERHAGLDGVVIVGLQRGGAWLAEDLRAALGVIDPTYAIPVGMIDVSMHRDDVGLRPIVPGAISRIDAPIDDAIVVLVDDVLYTGRTVRAALEAMNAYGRPRNIQLAVLVDRGHRELPIRPDYVGKNVPTHTTDDVEAGPEGIVVRGGVR